MTAACQTFDAYASQCPTRMVLDRIADKWAVLIMTHLTQAPCRFNALLRRIEGLSQKVLSQTLKKLERDGLVARTVFPTVPVTVEYALTPLGHTLAGSLAGVIDWAERNMATVLDAQQAYDARLAATGTASAQIATIRGPGRRLNDTAASGA